MTTIKVGETSPSFTATLTDAAGTAVNLAGMTVKMRMANASNGVNVINDATMTITNAATGSVKYDWLAADVDTAGVYLVEMWADLDGAKTPYPNDNYNVVEILPALAVGT